MQPDTSSSIEAVSACAMADSGHWLPHTASHFLTFGVVNSIPPPRGEILFLEQK